MSAVRLAVVATLSLSWTGSARAQGAATCSFDGATARVTVTVNQLPASLEAVAGSGEIRLDGVPCGAASVTNTDSIQVNGSPQPDDLSLSGVFAPGLTSEADGSSEIEINVALTTVIDHVSVHLADGNDRLHFGSNGIDVGNDGDVDIVTAGIHTVTIDAGAGDDVVRAYPYSGSTFLVVLGRSGRDTISGANTVRNELNGGQGDDILYGGSFPDELIGGPGNDLMFGRGSDDIFDQGAGPDGADDMRGGDGQDRVSYRLRTNAVTVTLGGSEPDGEPGEGDLVRTDVEEASSGDGDDLLVGNDARNFLIGGTGKDELYGGGGNDTLYGMGGADLLVGDDGNDVIDGGFGDDVIDGGRGDDILDGYDGDDTIDGGPGRDQFFGWEGDDIFFNHDGQAETVDCGLGIDDAEPSGIDTFIGCEL